MKIAKKMIKYSVIGLIFLSACKHEINKNDLINKRYNLVSMEFINDNREIIEYTRNANKYLCFHADSLVFIYNPNIKDKWDIQGDTLLFGLEKLQIINYKRLSFSLLHHKNEIHTLYNFELDH
ncbi:MAG: hypothetical protein N4A74_19055 [Carboxylicivirga sp.]|jgi:hypothetical protein|nr:hypothetical protein [Carboxylicivirga sp.]